MEDVSGFALVVGDIGLLEVLKASNEVFSGIKELMIETGVGEGRGYQI